MSTLNPGVSSAIVTEPVEATTIGSGAMPDETTVDAQVRLTADLLSPPDGPTLGLDPAEWATMADWMRQNGLLTKPLDVSQAVTERFLPETPS